MNWEVVTEFENKVAEFFGARGRLARYSSNENL